MRSGGSSGGWGLWWLAPVMLWLGVSVSLVGGLWAAVEVSTWIDLDPSTAQSYGFLGLIVMGMGGSLILAGIGLYVRNSSCCDDCDWEEHPTNTTPPHAH